MITKKSPLTVHPVTDYVNNNAQLKKKHPTWIQVTQNN